jgi:hypothetical protein
VNVRGKAYYFIMNGFDDDPFGSVNEQSAEELLREYMRWAEGKFFSDCPYPVVDLEIVDGPDPATFSTNRTIQLSKNIVLAQKMCKVLILHELIHNYLLQTKGDADSDEGPKFQAQVKRLWEKGAYHRLLWFRPLTGFSANSGANARKTIDSRLTSVCLWSTGRAYKTYFLGFGFFASRSRLILALISALDSGFEANILDKTRLNLSASTVMSSGMGLAFMQPF